MNLLKDLGPIGVSLPTTAKSQTYSLLMDAKELLERPEWRSTHFSGEKNNDQAMWLNEARAKVQRCVNKLEKILEVKNAA